MDMAVLMELSGSASWLGGRHQRTVERKDSWDGLHRTYCAITISGRDGGMPVVLVGGHGGVMKVS